MAAVPDPNNQRKYIENMAAGKTSTGGQATAGQIAWAKAQIPKLPAAVTPQSDKPPVTAPADIPNPSTGATTSGTSTMTVPTPPAVTKPPTEYDNWKAKQDELFGRLESLVNTPFSYNPETDPGYQAQRQLAQLRAGDASKAAMETMNASGLLQSTMTNSQLGQIQQRAEQEAAAYIPQYRDQAYGQFQDRLRSAADLLSTARNLRGDEFNRSVTEAELTGNYLSDKDRTAQPLLQNLITYGQEFGSATPERQAELRKLADDTRAQLASMGVDPSLYDPNLSTEQRQASLGKLGTRTLAGEHQDYAQQADQRDFEFRQAQQQWENLFNQAQFDESKAARVWEQAFKEKSFAQEVKDAAASRGLQWASLNQREREFIADQAFRDKEFKYQQEKDAAAAGTNDFEAEVMSGLRKFGSPDEARGWLTENAPEITKRLGREGYDDILKSLPSFYGITEKSDDSAIRQKAIDAAMKDGDWYSANEAERQALINKYMAYYQ
ncbi:hypothetical protein [Cohnella panacarvi]|uniref:hypothetical protein n=1 Tax=Cohnella panacarvi TaxID=400776 RepID=UPI00047A36EF|nr:hypothetical protein [Cohnella panacarvi]